MPEKWFKRLQKLHITGKQWRTFLKWTLYALVFVVTLVVQNVIFSRLRIFGTHVNLIPVCLIAVAVVEGTDSGGVYVLLCSLMWALSGADLGWISIFMLTCGSLGVGILLERLLQRNLATCMLGCMAVMLLEETAIFVVRLFLGSVVMFQYWRMLLPGVLLSILSTPAFYYLSHVITRVGGTD